MQQATNLKRISAILILHQLSGLSTQKQIDFLKRLDYKVEKVFDCSKNLLQQFSFSKRAQLLIDNINTETTHADVELLKQQVNWLQTNQVVLSHFGDKTYPFLLSQICDPPAVLYLKGDVSLLQAPQVAIVGSRKATLTGKHTAANLATALSQHGLAITSGLALGIDAAAHCATLEASGKTIAVLGTGIDRIYPERHATLAKRIAQNGLLVSEFALGEPPRRAHFPQRNRLISGLSLGVIVVEAGVKSGSLITADFALEQGRDVFAVPGSLSNSQAVGCHELIKQGAIFTQSAEDVIEQLNLNLLPTGAAQIDRVQHKVPEVQQLDKCSDDEKQLLNLIQDEGSTLQEIAEHCEVKNLYEMLCKLESKGYIRNCLGVFSRC